MKDVTGFIDESSQPAFDSEESHIYRQSLEINRHWLSLTQSVVQGNVHKNICFRLKFCNEYSICSLSNIKI